MKSKILNTAWKGISYLVLGALSHNLKEGVEGRLGSDCFDAKGATEANMLANLTIYPAAAVISLYRYTHDFGQLYAASLIGLTAGIVEYFVRSGFVDRWDENAASLLGKAVSLPVDLHSYLGRIYCTVKRKVEKNK